MWLVAKPALEKTSIHGWLEIETRSSSRDWKEVNSHSSGPKGGSHAGSGVIGASGHILLHVCQDAISGQAQDMWYAAT